MTDPTCPRCAKPLTKRTTARGLFYACEGCGGLALAMPVLRKVADPEQVEALWLQVQKRAVVPKFGGTPCPCCGRSMGQLIPKHATAAVEIDICTPCQFLWLDRDELAAFGPAPPAPARPLDPRSPGASRAARGTTENGDWNAADWSDSGFVFWWLVRLVLNAMS